MKTKDLKIYLKTILNKDINKNKKILEDFEIIKKELEHSEQRKHKKLTESHLDKEDMKIYRIRRCPVPPFV